MLAVVCTHFNTATSTEYTYANSDKQISIHNVLKYTDLFMQTTLAICYAVAWESKYTAVCLPLHTLVVATKGDRTRFLVCQGF